MHHLGKVQFISRFCEDRFDKDSLTTIGIDIKHKYVLRKGRKIELRICDTAGQERYKALAKNYFKSEKELYLCMI